MSLPKHAVHPSRPDRDMEPGFRDTELSSEVESLNLDALDIRELEQRIEMSVATDPVTNGYACGADCSSFCAGDCQTFEVCGTNDGSCTVDGCITDGGSCEYNEDDQRLEPVYIEPCNELR